MTTVLDHVLHENQNGCSATEDTLAVLIARALNEDRQAWVALHKRFQPLIIGTCFRYRVFGGDADDVSQTVWLQLVRNLNQIREPRALPGWILTTVRNTIALTSKNQQRVQPTDPMSTRLDRPDTSDPANTMETIERQQAVHEALKDLRPEHRLLMVMLHAERQVSYQEVSRKLGIPVGSIGPTRARVLKKLRSAKAFSGLA